MTFTELPKEVGGDECGRSRLQPCTFTTSRAPSPPPPPPPPHDRVSSHLAESGPSEEKFAQSLQEPADIGLRSQASQS